MVFPPSASEPPGPGLPPGQAVWPQDPGRSARAGERPAGHPRGGPRGGGDRREERTTLLLLWLPVALSTALLVLFVVVVSRQQQQAARVGDLLQRLQGLEQSRALERTAVLEQQLRAMLNRLQKLEKEESQLQDLERRLRILEQTGQPEVLPEARLRPRSPLEDRPSRPALPPLNPEAAEPLAPPRLLQPPSSQEEP